MCRRKRSRFRVTIKQGNPWHGIVKNRCKNGDHYWVNALVVPVRKNNETVGYMSVRREPSRQQVEAAEALYRQVREKHANLTATGAGFINNLSIKTRFAVFMGMMSFLLVTIGIAGLVGMNRSNDAHNTTYQARLEPSAKMGKILLRMADNRANVMLGLQRSGNPRPKCKTIRFLHTDAILRNAEEIGRLWKDITARNLNPDEKQIAEAVFKPVASMSRKGFFRHGTPCWRATMGGRKNYS